MLRKPSLALLLCLAAACNGDRDGTTSTEDTGPVGPIGTERTIQRIDVVGAQDADDCLTGTGAEFDFLFSIVDVDDRTVAPGSNVNNESLVLNESFTTGDVSFEDVVLYPSPDVICETDGDCGQLTGPYTCRQRNAEVRDSEMVCGFDVSIEMIQGSLRYLPEQSAAREKSIMVVVTNGSSILGLNEETGEARDRFSTDPDDRRIEAALDFVSSLQDIYPPEDSAACLTWFTGEGSPSMNFIPDENGCLQSLTEVGSGEQQAALRQITLNGEGIDEGQRSTWAAIRVAIEHLASNTSASFDRHVVVFTDGPDNGSNSAARQTPEFVSELAGLQGVRVHIVQLDNPFDGAEIGPLEALENVGCATGGTFLYSRDPEGVVRNFRNLRTAISNRYGIQMRIPELAELPAGAFRLAASISMDVNGDVGTARLSGDNSDQINIATDSRLVLRTR
ncbi:MAG: hypothetical protein ACJAYU_000513 [Bradymonadia bacterium]|jgi:hypothetical protein